MALCANFQLCGMRAVCCGRCVSCLNLRIRKSDEDCPLCAQRGPVAILPCGHTSCYTCTAVQRGSVNPFLFPDIKPPFNMPLLVAKCKKCQSQWCKCLVPDFQTLDEAHKDFFSRDTVKGACLQCHPRGELPSHGKYLVTCEGPDDTWGAEAREAHEVV